MNVAAYSLETVVAEKFQTMIDRSEGNSRMKDFFDVYTILKSGKMDAAVLEDAVREVMDVITKALKPMWELKKIKYEE